MTDIPQSFDRFEIVRILGRGGMGTVYLGRDLALGRSVAIKVLNAEGLESDERRARFEREARSAAAVRHQNVATIYEVGETEEGQPFIVMEYCEGETLSQRLRRRPLDAGEWLHIAQQIAAGLAAAHDQGIVHRDIKAANIIIEPTGLVKILDFGLAKLLARDITVTAGPTEHMGFESTTGHFFGTLHYISPEQAHGANADERSDLFSVGVVLYQMAAGHLPFNADAPLLVLEKIRDSEPEPFVAMDGAFPPAGTKVISRLLQKDPGDRYQNARELLRDLESIDTPTLKMTQATSRSTLGRTIQRPKWIQVTVLVATALIVFIAVLVVRRGGGPSFGESSTTSTSAAQPIRSMAVLPLQNLANNTRDDFLSVGLADALTTKLQEVPALRVRPTSAVLEFRGKKVDATSAGKTLQVDGVLEGHFLAAGDLVRVNLQLTDARTGYNVWADTIDGKRDDLLKLIDDVSARTVTGLNAKLDITPQNGPKRSEARSSNPKAYEEYLKARSLNGSFTPRDYQAQIAALKRAIDLDPNFAAAYADLALALSLGYARSLATEPLERAEWYARQAVRLDANLPEAHLALGRVFVRYPDRFPESMREVMTALRLKPNETQALWGMATYFVSTGELQNVQCVADRLIAVDPMSNEAKTRGYWYINAIDTRAAIENAKAALASKDTEVAGHDIRGYAYLLDGNLIAADKEADAAIDLVPSSYLGKSLKALIAAAQGDRATAEARIASFSADAERNHWAAIRAAQCYAKLGDRDHAIKWLKRSAELGHHSWYALVKHPWLQSLQTDPEFQEVVTKIKKDLDDVHDDVIGAHQLICP